MKKNKIYIFGHSGYIGSSLCEKLKHLKIDFSYRKNLNKRRIKFQDIDIKKIVAKFDTIIFLTSITDLKFSEKNIDKSIKISFLPIIKIIDHANKINKKIKIVFTSSTTVFGKNTYNKKLNENSNTDPITIYDFHKKIIEDQLIYAQKSNIIDLVILRLSNVYGNSFSNSVNKNRNIMNKIIQNALKTKKINLYSHGKFYRDFIYIDDVISAIIKSIMLKYNRKLIYHICYGKSYTLKYVYDLAKKIIKIKHNIDVKISNIQFPKDIHNINKRHFRIDNSDTKKILKWYPKISLVEGLKKII
tara:strand:- start:7417 stop:8322 length:906 start_codon:yes stop_codon:yes gene_type:complete